MVSHNPAKFGGYKQCGSKDIIVLVFHAISQDYETEASNKLICVSSSRQVVKLPNLRSIGTVIVEIC